MTQDELKVLIEDLRLNHEFCPKEVILQAADELERMQKQGEPVAWMHVMDNTEGLKANGTGIVSITQKRKHPFGKAGVDFSKSYPVTSKPLYTTPQQRKPLTDGQINAIWDSLIASPDYSREMIVRAIEAAHGIKE